MDLSLAYTAAFIAAKSDALAIIVAAMADRTLSPVQRALIADVAAAVRRWVDPTHGGPILGWRADANTHTWSRELPAMPSPAIGRHQGAMGANSVIEKAACENEIAGHRGTATVLRRIINTITAQIACGRSGAGITLSAVRGLAAQAGDTVDVELESTTTEGGTIRAVAAGPAADAILAIPDGMNIIVQGQLVADRMLVGSVRLAQGPSREDAGLLACVAAAGGAASIDAALADQALRLARTGWLTAPLLDPIDETRITVTLTSLGAVAAVSVENNH